MSISLYNYFIHYTSIMCVRVCVCKTFNTDKIILSYDIRKKKTKCQLRKLYTYIISKDNRDVSTIYKNILVTIIYNRILQVMIK